MGLLDPFLGGMGQDEQMMLAAGLLRGNGNLGANLSQGLLGAQQQRQGRTERELEQIKLQQMKQQMEQRKAQEQAVQGMLAGNPELAQLYQVNPEMALRQMFPEPQKPRMQFAPDGTAVDMNSVTPGQKFAKPTGPQPGQTREIKTGGRIITYEWDGQKWAKLAEAPQFKPESNKTDTPKPPPGYRFAPDGSKLEAIPGGPADAKEEKVALAEQNRRSGAINTAKVTLSKVQDAIKNTGFTTTGAMGAMGRNIPGTKAFDLNKTVDTIKANIGFDKLQAMREASPTGGALGNVAIQELNMLQATLGSLDTAQSDDQLLKTLYAIEKHYTNWLRAVEGSQEGQAAGGFKYLGKEGQ